jgi:hypothetical protein
MKYLPILAKRQCCEYKNFCLEHSVAEQYKFLATLVSTPEKILCNPETSVVDPDPKLLQS